MKAIFNKIWELALPYQDKRDDAGHAEIALRYARELVTLEKGDENVIIPSIILHDIGWSQLVKERWTLVFDKGARAEEKRSVQIEHQNESVKIANGILREVDYPAELTKEILEIISQHDTREGFISKNEGLVRDADKLWRTSQEGFATDEKRTNSSASSHFKKIEADIHKPNYFYSETARQIATAELKLRL
jgi:HD superfamily phosphodiesterase